jgi:hypothetical protein
MEESQQKQRNKQQNPSRDGKIGGFRYDIGKHFVPGHDCLLKAHSKSRYFPDVEFRGERKMVQSSDRFLGWVHGSARPAADQNDWSSQTHRSCTANDARRRIREDTWTQMALRPAGSSSDNIRCCGSWTHHRCAGAPRL